MILLSIYVIVRNKESKSRVNLFTKQGWILGVFLFGGYLFQTIGLNYTNPSNAAFITSLSVILVPVIMVLRGNKLTLPIIFSFSLAIIGMAFLTINFINFQVNLGDIIILGTAISVALQIVFTSEYVKNETPLNLSMAQLLSMTVLSFIFAMVFEFHDYSVVNSYPQDVIFAIVFTAMLATVYAYMVQTFAQEIINPIIVAIIYTLEPIFALLYSLWVGLETLNVIRGIGMILILIATIIAIYQENKNYLNPSTQ